MSKSLGHRKFSEKMGTLLSIFWVTWHVRVESCCVQDSRWALVQYFSGGGIPRKLTWHWKIPKKTYDNGKSIIWRCTFHSKWGFSNVMFVFRWSYTTTLFLLLQEVRSCSWFGDFGGKVHIQRGVEVFSRATDSFKTFKFLGIWFWCHFQNPEIDTTFTHICC